MNRVPRNGYTDPPEAVADDAASARYEARRRRQLGLGPVGSCPECQALPALMRIDEGGVTYCKRCNWREDGT